MYSEQRDLPEFRSVLLKSVGNVIVKIAEKQEVRIESDQNIASHIKTKVKDGQLVIGIKEVIPLWLVGMPRINIYISVTDLELLKVSGVGSIKSNDVIKTEKLILINSGVGGIHLKVEADKIDSELSGVGEIELQGKAGKHFINVSGTGKVNAYDLETADVDIKNSGVGECIVFANESLHVYSSGIGRVKYRGKASIRGSHTGLGGIERLE